MSSPEIISQRFRPLRGSIPPRTPTSSDATPSFPLSPPQAGWAARSPHTRPRTRPVNPNHGAAANPARAAASPGGALFTPSPRPPATTALTRRKVNTEFPPAACPYYFPLPGGPLCLAAGVQLHGAPAEASPKEKSRNSTDRRLSMAEASSSTTPAERPHGRGISDTSGGSKWGMQRKQAHSHEARPTATTLERRGHRPAADIYRTKRTSRRPIHASHPLSRNTPACRIASGPAGTRATESRPHADVWADTYGSRRRVAAGHWMDGNIGPYAASGRRKAGLSTWSLSSPCFPCHRFLPAFLHIPPTAESRCSAAVCLAARGVDPASGQPVLMLGGFQRADAVACCRAVLHAY